MNMMKDIIGDLRTKSYAEANLSHRMTEALQERKVAKARHGMPSGALQMNFRAVVPSSRGSRRKEHCQI